MKRITLFTLCSLALAQPPVAPTNEQVGPLRGENTSEYNVINSFELGYRWATIGGDGGMYNSTVNYGDGIRLYQARSPSNRRTATASCSTIS